MARISACIPFRERDERLLRLTIESVLSEKVDEIMLCNFGQKSLAIHHPKIFHIHIPLDRWRLGLGFNISAIAASGDVLLLILGDIVIGDGLVSNSLPLLILGKQFVSSTNFVFRCSEKATVRYMKGNGKQTDLAVGGERHRGPNLQGSFYMIYRNDYFRIGGHDSEMQGWGREDVCFHRRARELGYKRALGPGMIFHLYDGYGTKRQNEQDWRINHTILKRKVTKDWWRCDKR